MKLKWGNETMNHVRWSEEFRFAPGSLRRIRWARATVGGVLAELAVFAIVFPVLYFFGQTAFLASILIASAAMPFLFALWVNRRVESH